MCVCVCVCVRVSRSTDVCVCVTESQSKAGRLPQTFIADHCVVLLGVESFHFVTREWQNLHSFPKLVPPRLVSLHKATSPGGRSFSFLRRGLLFEAEKVLVKTQVTFSYRKICPRISGSSPTFSAEKWGFKDR